MSIEAIKKALEDFAPMTLEFTPTSSEGNSIIRPTDEFEGRYFTVIGCGDKQDALGQMMTLAVNALPDLLSTLESLQRENERLRQFLFPYADRTDISGISWDGKYLIGDNESIRAFHEMQNRGLQIDVYKRVYDQKEAALTARAEAAEAEVKRLRERLEPFSRFAGVLFERNFNRTDSVAGMDDVDGVLHTISAGTFFDARKALASTGGEHHAE